MSHLQVILLSFVVYVIPSPIAFYINLYIRLSILPDTFLGELQLLTSHACMYVLSVKMMMMIIYRALYSIFVL